MLETLHVWPVWEKAGYIKRITVNPWNGLEGEELLATNDRLKLEPEYADEQRAGEYFQGELNSIRQP